ncbi:unnamed protein product [Vitrella brassicaformis CCMP3155]|uniref:CPW-WPC domain-containing protein n=1 Tax=Vitrella brassicaformis (strain CCMP3155) TaxID=1169540 RepID=A0A0G4FXC0_VITBC|nr:unnamed protein product [Vitrella brassicaformis CCMP3155]|eukprot:CEM20047.1 unnamed protein product [Vitrella brassicaformis CCMP3155]
MPAVTPTPIPFLRAPAPLTAAPAPLAERVQVPREVSGAVERPAPKGGPKRAIFPTEEIRRAQPKEALLTDARPVAMMMPGSAIPIHAGAKEAQLEYKSSPFQETALGSVLPLTTLVARPSHELPATVIYVPGMPSALTDGLQLPKAPPAAPEGFGKAMQTITGFLSKILGLIPPIPIPKVPVPGLPGLQLTGPSANELATLAQDGVSYARSQRTEEFVKEEADSRAQQLAAQLLNKYWFIGQCRRDYSPTCPLQWTDEGGVCSPPDGYDGFCRATNLTAATPIEKETFAWKCRAEWSCVSSPRRDWTATCPHTWTNVGGNLCIAPSNYRGICPPAMDFSSFDPETKAIFAAKCHLEWPTEAETARRPTAPAVTALPKLAPTKPVLSGVSGPVDAQTGRVITHA